jgi:RHS repeat-associated protein
VEEAVTFSYDADQQKVARVRPGETTLFFDDFYYRVDTASSNDLVHHYVISNGQTAVAEVRRGDGQASMDVRFLHQDNVGSVVALTSIAGAAETRSFDYFGASTPSDLSNLGYTGNHDEGFAGLIEMKGRTYDPLVGQFLQPDPIVSDPYTVQGFNHYSYVGNNPLRFTDPSGFQGCDELSKACQSFVPDATAQPLQSTPIPEPNTGPSMNMMSVPPPGGGTLSSIESGANPVASGRAFSTESSAASGPQSMAPSMASIVPRHLQWNGQPLRYFMGRLTTLRSRRSMLRQTVPTRSPRTPSHYR